MNCIARFCSLSRQIRGRQPRARDVALLTAVLVTSMLLMSGSLVMGQGLIAKSHRFKDYLKEFEAAKPASVTNAIPDSEAWEWIEKNVPLFECPDETFEKTYLFRWWSFRKHIVKTPSGYVITEFLTPVSHAGAYNTISCAAGFHIMEGRWLADRRYISDYIRFWLRGKEGKPQPHFHKFSSWFPWAVWQYALATGDTALAVDLLPDLVTDYRLWEGERQLPGGMFWQFDVRDGMEESISGSRTKKNVRPTINSYMFANAQAIAAIARFAGNEPLAREYDNKAATLRDLVESTLWDSGAKFFKVKIEGQGLSATREAIGFIPWMFSLPHTGKGFEDAWSQMRDPKGFAAPFGLTTAERRDPQFRSHGIGTCEWDGAIWPFATSQTLAGLANVVRDYPQAPVEARDYFEALLTFSRSHASKGHAYIGEYMDEMTGDWIDGKNDRSRFYNHSSFADLVITGLIGLLPQPGKGLQVHPLLPEKTWDWFCLDRVPYRGRTLSILWDRDGSRYQKGAGLMVFENGKELARTTRLTLTKVE